MRAVSNVLSYLLALVALIFVALMLSVSIVDTFLPFAKQRIHVGNAVRVAYVVGADRVKIHVVNTKNYEVRIDVLLRLSNGSFTTECPINGTDVAIDMRGILIRPHGKLDLVCYVADVVDVRVVEYGGPYRTRATAYAS